MNGERLLRHDEAELLAASVRSAVDGLNEVLARATRAGVRVEVNLFWKEFNPKPFQEGDDLSVFGRRPDFSNGCVQIGLERVSRDL